MSFIDYPEETVTITRSEYDSLCDDARWRAGVGGAGVGGAGVGGAGVGGAGVGGAGVDNWDGFDWAMKEYYGDDDE